MKEPQANQKPPTFHAIVERVIIKIDEYVYGITRSGNHMCTSIHDHTAFLFQRVINESTNSRLLEHSKFCIFVLNSTITTVNLYLILRVPGINPIQTM